MLTYSNCSKKLGTISNGGIRSQVTSVLCTCSLLLAMTGCGFLNVQSKPTSIGETVSGYTYIPIDPTKVQIKPGECAINYSDIGDDPQKKKVKLLDMLPDNAVRMSMETTDSKGNVSYGVSKAGVLGSTYKLTADYVNSDTVNISVWIRKTMLVQYSYSLYGDDGKVKKTDQQTEREPVSFAQDAVLATRQRSGLTDNIASPSQRGFEERRVLPGTEQYDVISVSEKKLTEEQQAALGDFVEFNVPIYVGIGLRIVAEGVSMSGDAIISGIGVIGAEAEAKRLMGSLTVQTLGVNSQAVASALPVQSELSRTTAENAFVAIGSIKAMLHQPETIKFPRVVGLYLPIPGGKPLVNALISELSRNPVTWCPNGYAVKDYVKPF